ncbi:MAG TPA: hypothetical protein VFQ53_25465 [Kofleriaceae bacterium]|nr:hypothetical protein [Kofleriaceae bacterium]
MRRAAIALAVVACGMLALAVWQRHAHAPVVHVIPMPPQPATSVTCFWTDSAETCLARVEAAYQLGVTVAPEPTKTQLQRPPRRVGPMTGDEFRAWMIVMTPDAAP